MRISKRLSKPQRVEIREGLEFAPEVGAGGHRRRKRRDFQDFPVLPPTILSLLNSIGMLCATFVWLAEIGTDMSSSDKTELQRDILLTWHDNPGATNKEIAEACDCSASYVSQVKNRFDGYNEMEAMFDREDRELEQMFGNGILEEGTGTTVKSGEQQGLAEIYKRYEANATGLDPVDEADNS